MRCPKLFARCSLRTISTATPTNAPCFVHRTRSRMLLTALHPEMFYCYSIRLWYVPKQALLLRCPKLFARCSLRTISTAAPLRHKTTLIIFSQSSKSSTLRCGFGPQKATLFGGPFGSLFRPQDVVACCAQTRRSASLCSGCRVLNFIHCKNKDFYAIRHRSLYFCNE